MLRAPPKTLDRLRIL